MVLLTMMFPAASRKREEAPVAVMALLTVMSPFWLPPVPVNTMTLALPVRAAFSVATFSVALLALAV